MSTCFDVMEQNDEELNPSILGTQQYWNKFYATELANFKDHGDVGEVWFGEDSARRIVTWLNSHVDVIQKSHSILDLGCGNGMFLINLHKSGFTNLYGVDYSENAISLAQAISKHLDVNINFSVLNILDEKVSLETYNVILDKGTYDAISLDPADRSTKRQQYISNVYRMLKVNGYFVITSCNWTDEELVSQFSGLFKCHEKLHAPKFTFGGKSGNTVTSLIFTKIQTETQ